MSEASAGLSYVSYVALCAVYEVDDVRVLTMDAVVDCVLVVGVVLESVG